MKEILVATRQRSSSKVESPFSKCPVSLLSIIIHVGSGMYLDSHGYFLNNSIVIAYSGYSCYSRKLYCYSDSSWYDIGHVRAYNGRTSSSYHNYLSVSRQNPAGLLLQYRTCNNLHPGIYTCEIPDSNGQITESSIAVYSSTPSEFMYKINKECTQMHSISLL